MEITKVQTLVFSKMFWRSREAFSSQVKDENNLKYGKFVSRQLLFLIAVLGKKTNPKHFSYLMSLFPRLAPGIVVFLVSKG